MYYEIWQKYDPNGTEFIPYNEMFDFVADLEKPLGIPRPNRLKLISMDLPICENDMVYCVDILGENFFLYLYLHDDSNLKFVLFFSC